MEIENGFQAKHVANRIAAQKRIIAALRTAQEDLALSEEDRKCVRWSADDLEGDFNTEALEDVLSKWIEFEDYGGPEHTAYRSAAE